MGVLVELPDGSVCVGWLEAHPAVVRPSFAVIFIEARNVVVFTSADAFALRHSSCSSMVACTMMMMMMIIMIIRRACDKNLHEHLHNHSPCLHNYSPQTLA
jgi:hypothetical protein